jgi:rhodanese-related sulfurtransferase
MRRLLKTAALGSLMLLASGRAATITPLGVLYAGEETTLEVPVHNPAGTSVEVIGAETSCECLVPQFDPTNIPAGETRFLRFRYHSSTIGRMRVDIDYATDSGKSAIKQSVAGIIARRDQFLTAAQLRDLIGREDATIVDMRSADRFGAARIARSLNLPAFALRHRTDLMTRQLVLIDEGFSPAALAQDAASLRSAGFKSVRIFEGGIAAWIRAGGVVEGQAGSAHVAARITPAEYLRVGKNNPWQVVSATAVTPTAEDYGSTAHVGRVPPRILVVGKTDADYVALEQLNSADTNARVFYLTGGELALAAYQRDQLRMSTNSGATFQSKSTQPHVVATSGCGTCPK